MSAIQLPEFFRAMGNFRSALDELENRPGDQTREHRIVLQIMSNMLEEAYIKIARALGSELTEELKTELDNREIMKACTINMNGRQLQAIMVGLLKNGDPSKVITLCDDGISFQALLVVDKYRSKKIYESESLVVV